MPFIEPAMVEGKADWFLHSGVSSWAGSFTASCIIICLISFYLLFVL